MYTLDIWLYKFLFNPLATGDTPVCGRKFEQAKHASELLENLEEMFPRKSVDHMKSVWNIHIPNLQQRYLGKGSRLSISPE